MKPKNSTAKPSAESLDARAIDALYGLEPVFEPDGPSGELQPFVAVKCPYCGETFETRVDLSAGSFRYVEDCSVCCQAIELAGEVGDDFGLRSFTAEKA